MQIYMQNLPINIFPQDIGQAVHKIQTCFASFQY